MTTFDTPAPEGQPLVIAELTIAGRSAAEIASELGCSPSTVYRNRREHRDWIDQRSTERASEVAASLLAATTAALARLLALVNSPNDPVALGAAKFILDSASRWRNEIDLERRLALLEQERSSGYGLIF